MRETKKQKVDRENREREMNYWSNHRSKIEEDSSVNTMLSRANNKLHNESVEMQRKGLRNQVLLALATVIALFTIAATIALK